MRKAKTLSTCIKCVSLISRSCFKRRQNHARMGMIAPQGRGGDNIIGQATRI